MVAVSVLSTGAYTDFMRSIDNREPETKPDVRQVDMIAPVLSAWSVDTFLQQKHKWDVKTTSTKSQISKDTTPLRAQLLLSPLIHLHW